MRLVGTAAAEHNFQRQSRERTAQDNLCFWIEKLQRRTLSSAILEHLPDIRAVALDPAADFVFARDLQILLRRVRTSQFGQATIAGRATRWRPSVTHPTRWGPPAARWAGEGPFRAWARLELLPKAVSFRSCSMRVTSRPIEVDTTRLADPRLLPSSPSQFVKKESLSEWAAWDYIAGDAREREKAGHLTTAADELEPGANCGYGGRAVRLSGISINSSAGAPSSKRISPALDANFAAIAGQPLAVFRSNGHDDRYCAVGVSGIIGGGRSIGIGSSYPSLNFSLAVDEG